MTRTQRMALSVLCNITGAIGSLTGVVGFFDCPWIRRFSELLLVLNLIAIGATLHVYRARPDPYDKRRV